MIGHTRQHPRQKIIQPVHISHRPLASLIRIIYAIISISPLFRLILIQAPVIVIISFQPIELFLMLTKLVFQLFNFLQQIRRFF
ncbi:hypothetical protein D3C77_559000 [compost metagenome]